VKMERQQRTQQVFQILLLFDSEGWPVSLSPAELTDHQRQSAQHSFQCSARVGREQSAPAVSPWERGAAHSTVARRRTAACGNQSWDVDRPADFLAAGQAVIERGGAAPFTVQQPTLRATG